MASPTTYRGEVAATFEGVNRRDFVVLGDRLAGSSPKNPIHVGLGVTLTVTTGTVTAASVTGKMILATDVAASESASFNFIQDPNNSSFWIKEGAIGGSSLGFPQLLDFDMPKPFELEIVITFRGGSQTYRVGFWVSNSDGYTEIECIDRDHFVALYKNCCLNGMGFRGNNTAFGGVNLFSEYGDNGEFDLYFDPAGPADNPGAYATWAIGTGPIAGGLLTMVCRPNRELLNPYLPDSVTGLTTNRPDNPFIQPTTTITAPARDDLLDPYGKLVTTIDGTLNESLSYPSLPLDSPPDPLGFSWTPGDRYNLPGLSAIALPPAPREAADVSGAVKAGLTATWVDSTGVTALGSEISLSTFAAGSEPRPQFTLSNTQAGTRVYLMVSALRADFTGPIVPPAVAPLGMFSLYDPQPREIPRVRDGVTIQGDGNSPLVMGLGFDNSIAPNLYLQPFSVSGSGSGTWNPFGPGSAITLGAGGTFTFSLAPDVTYLTTVLSALQASGAILPMSSVTLWFQGIVFEPTSTTATPDTNIPVPTTQGAAMGFDATHGAYLTTIASMNVRA